MRYSRHIPYEHVLQEFKMDATEAAAHPAIIALRLRTAKEVERERGEWVA